MHFGEGSDGEDFGEGVLVGRSGSVVGGTVVGERSREIEMLSSRGLTTVMDSRGGRAIRRAVFSATRRDCVVGSSNKVESDMVKRQAHLDGVVRES